jgi:fumarate reductase (CoM/CoB) subunit A
VNIEKAIYIKGVSYPFTIRNESKWVDVAVYTEIAEGRGTEHNGVYMDISHNDPSVIETEARVPFNHLMKYGIDLREDKVEFAPAIQHFNGGVHIDVKAASTIPGLYAAGENAGGQHGADRPGGNALADCQAHGKIAGESAAEFIRARESSPLDSKIKEQIEKEYAELVAEQAGSVSADQAIADLNWVMWKNASVVRTAKGLESAISYISSAPRPIATPGDVQKVLDYRNMLTVGKMVVKSALMRSESRGTHYRSDCAAVNDPEWLKQILIAQKDGEICLTTRPIELPPELQELKRALEGMS